MTNGQRFFTYVIEGKPGSGVICTNGAAAHLAREGDTVIIASFASYNENEEKRHEPKLVYVNGKNKIKKIKPEPNKLTLAYSAKPLI